MRQERTIQMSIFDVFAGHEIGRELQAMSEWLDAHSALLGLVAEDLRRDGVRATGRRGLPAEAVLRCALLKQYRQLSYEELAFHLEDSASFRAFARRMLFPALGDPACLTSFLSASVLRCLGAETRLASMIWPDIGM